MILRKLILENFRQFKGLQEIVFERDLPNITIIYGENGRGKTGLFRALLFGLFDDRKLSQDDNINSRDITLVNKQALNENEGIPVSASVTVVMESMGIQYVIKRCIKGIKKGNQIGEESSGVSLVITDEKGNTKPTITDPVEIGEYVGKIFDPKIKEYFLFDGEKIERLTRADSTQKKTVAQGIRNLLSINDLETARHSMEILRTNLNNQLDSKSQGNLQKTLRAINDNAKSIETTRDALEVAKEELECAIKQKEKYDSDLEKIDDIKDVLKKRKEYSDEEADLRESQNIKINYLASKLSQYAQTLLSATFRNVYRILDSKKESGEIPVQDKLELIKKILSEKRCICGNCVKEGSPEFNEIIAWRTRINDSGLSDEALNIWRDLNTLLQLEHSSIEEIQRILAELENGKNRLSDLREALKSISETINDGTAESASRLNKLQEECRKAIFSLQIDIRDKEKELQSLETEKDNLAKLKDKYIQEEGVKSELLAAANLASDTFTALDNIFQSFTQDMKQQLGEQASKIMSHLLDKEGRFSLSRIVVKDDYSLQVNDLRDEPFLANISAGQRQIISLCFITALAQVANGSDRFEIPLFMDTPFGRLSFEHRDNLIRFIPTICQQWITLVTDTELTNKEWAVYQNSNFRCVFYKLQAQKDGTTKIVPIPIDKVSQTI